MAVAELKGVVELKDVLENVLPREARAGIRRAFRSVLNEVRALSQAKAPKDEGDLKRSIKVRAGKRRRNEVAVMLVAGGDAAPHANLQELGWIAGKIKKTHVPAKAFLRGPFYESRDAVEAAVADELRALGVRGKFTAEDAEGAEE